MLRSKIPRHELAFDVDGVIADTFRTFVSIAHNEFGVSVQYEDITEYDFRKVTEDIDEDTSKQIIDRILVDPLGVGIQPIEGAVPVLRRLLALGPILLVTARTVENGILQWMQTHVSIEDQGRIQLIATGAHREKLPILMDYGIKYFVEDRLETCYLLDEVSITPIVFTQPWNQKPHPFKTVENWDEIEGLIEWEG